MNIKMSKCYTQALRYNLERHKRMKHIPSFKDPSAQKVHSSSVSFNTEVWYYLGKILTLWPSYRIKLNHALACISSYLSRIWIRMDWSQGVFSIRCKSMYFLLAQQSPWGSLGLLFLQPWKLGRWCITPTSIGGCTAKLKWSFCCWDLCCSNSLQASQGWKNWMLLIFINSFQLFHSRQSRHLPSNCYMGFMFSSLTCPWFKVTGRVLFHIFLCLPFFVCMFFLFLCKRRVSFHFLFWAVWGKRVLVSCHLSVNRSHIWSVTLLFILEMKQQTGGPLSCTWVSIIRTPGIKYQQSEEEPTLSDLKLIFHFSLQWYSNKTGSKIHFY